MNNVWYNHWRSTPSVLKVDIVAMANVATLAARFAMVATQTRNFDEIRAQPSNWETTIVAVAASDPPLSPMGTAVRQFLVLASFCTKPEGQN